VNIQNINLPGSKSITNRALLLSALAPGKTVLINPLFSDDTKYMADALRQLGPDIKETSDSIEITGKILTFEPEKNKPPIELFIGNAGTTIRFLTTFLSTLKNGVFILKGEPRMHQRPIRDLVEPLKKAGARIEYLEKEGYPPLKIHGTALDFDLIEMDGSKSSQYISSVLLLLPKINPGARLIVKDLVSRPYIDTTLSVMRQFGVEMEHKDYREFFVKNGTYTSGTFEIPADASSASYFLAGAFLKNKPLRLNVGENCMQGDFLFVQILREMGGLFEISGNETVFLRRNKRFSGIHTDMNEIPDTVQTLAVLSLFAQTPTLIKNVANLRIKETDRIDALKNELSKTGAKVIAGKDFIKIIPHPQQYYRPASIKTYEDHRMAMSFALAQLRIPGLKILNPGVVSKSFSDFWEYWETFHATV
jgi:3-phosphoshikimate 1-carboxyvinyltransferase